MRQEVPHCFIIYHDVKHNDDDDDDDDTQQLSYSRFLKISSILQITLCMVVVTMRAYVLVTAADRSSRVVIHIFGNWSLSLVNVGENW
uniref:Uncharacterized protein n=1 Tax=Glossina brevipalpis TaxID=37001 RepID=A0A1A9W1S1_9MUSC